MTDTEHHGEAAKDYATSVFSNILDNEDTLLKLDLPNSSGSPRSNLFKDLFPQVPATSRKRKLQEFLQDYNQLLDHAIVLNNDHQDDQSEQEEDDDEDEVVERSQEVMEALYSLDFPIDKLFRKTLKYHQIEGLKFMWERVYVKRQGCLLAHSMGLGKTIQIISLLTTMYQQLRRNPEAKFPNGNRVLILAPLVTLTNWVDEFDKWAVSDRENVIGEVYNISELNNANQKNERMRYLKHWYTSGGVLLINYDLYRSSLSSNHINDKEDYYKYLVNPGADIVILDEAHRIKNSSSLLASHVRKIRTKARICLTGYPLQNHLVEYYYMINFIAPGLLGSRELFKSYFSNIIEKCYSDSSKATKLDAAFKLYVLQLLTGHVTHRRNEAILEKDLPPKTEYVVRFKMTPAQHQGYSSVIQLVSAGPNPMVALLVLRALCNHPKIFQSLLLKRQEKKRKDDFHRRNQEDAEDDADFIDDDEIDEYIDRPALAATSANNNNDGNETFKVAEETLDSDIVEDNEEAAFERWASIGFEWAPKYFENADIESWKCSGKISFIADLARDCKIVGEKIVIVSHSLACLDYIQHLLPIFGIKTSRLDGSVKAVERQHILNTFHEDKTIGVMLLSAKAAAIGINITAANRIVLVDQDWNPLYDEQSIGRIYRYGQTKPVIVYRLVTSSTIEERIYLQSVHKRSISRRVIDNKAAIVISKEDLVEYFIAPSEDLGLIDIDDVPREMDLDWITLSALQQNKDCITDFKEYEEDIKKDNAQEMVQIVSPHMREKARHEALSLIRDWQNAGAQAEQ